jgi:LPS sulfotransferase NodH
MVCDDIAGTKVLGHPSEYFIKVIENIGITSSDEMNKLIENAIQKGKSENGISAVKIMSNQIIPIGRALKDASICKENNKEECFYQFFKDAIFVRVIRNDKVAQAVSRVMAKQTDVYHAFSTLKGFENRVGKVSKERDESFTEYNSNTIKNEIVKIENEEKFLDEFINKYKLDVNNIIYEEVVNNREYVELIANKLDIHSIKLAERRLKKISGQESKNWILQYKGSNI